MSLELEVGNPDSQNGFILTILSNLDFPSPQCYTNSMYVKNAYKAADLHNLICD